jgi:hypothetical protein
MKLIKNFTQLATVAGLALVFGIIGCNKEVTQDTPATEEQENLTMASQDDAIADQVYTEIHEQELGMMDEIGLPDIGLNNEVEATLDSAGRCFKVTIEPRQPLVFPKTVVFDYGTGCKGRDGKIRRGKIITVYSAPMIVPGATATTRFDGFSVDSVKVSGVHISKNNSTSSVRIFTRRVENGKLIFSGGGVTIWNATHTNKQIAGLGTPGFPFDDEFEITGGAKGVFERATKRIEWSRVIAEPLHKTFKCRWIDKGVVHVTRGVNKSILNYGDGTCDNKAVITINGVKKEITL